MQTKVLLAIRSLQPYSGGAQRQLIEIAKMLCETGIVVEIITLDSDDVTEDAKLHYRIEEIPLHNIPPIVGRGQGKFNTLLQRTNRLSCIYSLISKVKPTIIISFMFGAFSFVAIPAKLKRISCVLAERNSPFMYRQPQYRRQRILLFLFMMLARKITIQFPGYAHEYPRFLRSRIRVIPNSVTKQMKREPRMVDPLGKLVIGFVGRMEIQKNPTAAIETAAILRNEGYPFILRMYGEGSCLEKIREKIRGERLEDYCELITEYIPSAEIFNELDVLLHPAVWEGFPNAVGESLAFGIPVVGFAECDGLRELVNDGENGKLVSRRKGSQGLADAVREILVLRNMSGETMMMNRCQNSIKEYDPERVKDAWYSFITEMI